jgi:tight adherence protein B
VVDRSAGILLVGFLVFLAVASGMVAAAMLLESARDRRRRRQFALQLEKLQVSDLEPSADAATLFRPDAPASARWVRVLIPRLSHLRNIQSVLEQAALTWGVQGYLLRCLGFSAGLGLALLIVTGSGVYTLLGAAAGAAAPYLFVRNKRARRVAAYEANFPQAIDLLVRALRAGHPVSSGFKMVADESPEPIAGEFRRIFEEQRFGLPFEDSILAMADRIPLTDVRIFVTAVLIQREVGGNLAEILDKLAYVIRERFQIRGQIRVLTAQGRMGGYVVGVLPIGVGFMVFLLEPEMMLDFLAAPVGRVAIAGAVMLQTVGMLWIRRIVNIEV